MLFHCDANWDVVGVQAWNAPGIVKPASVQEIKDHAERYYAGVASKWTTHPASREDALAYYEAHYCTDRCSFCSRAIHEIRFLVSGENHARICDLCIERLHGELTLTSGRPA
jgi:hypothetical protein